MSKAPPQKKIFRLRPGEPLPSALRRIVGEEIDVAVAAVESGAKAEQVHEVRKVTKRLRALVRLMRDQLGDRLYRRENGTLRDVGRALSPARDAEVLVATADRLIERFGDDGQLRALRAVRHAARARLEKAHGAGADRRRIASELRRVRARVARWPIERDGWRGLRPGLRRVYQRSRSTWRAAAANPSLPRLHEWRKRAKDLRYALELLEPLWPEVMQALTDEVDALGERLGEDHDLALLRRFAVEVGDGDDLHAVLAVIDVSRRDLQAASWGLAARIYEATTRRFSRRVAAYWRAWQAAPADAASPDSGAERQLANA